KVDAQRADDRPRQDGLFFIVCRNQDIDARQAWQDFKPTGLPGRLKAAVPGTRESDKAGGPADNRDRFRPGKCPGVQAVESKCEWRQRLSNPPPQITPGQQDADAEQRRPGSLAFRVEKRQNHYRAADYGQTEPEMLHTSSEPLGEAEEMPQALDHPSCWSTTRSLEYDFAGASNSAAIALAFRHVEQLNRDLVAALFRRDRETPAGGGQAQFR